jgi:hypothetical protein
MFTFTLIYDISLKIVRFSQVHWVTLGSRLAISRNILKYLEIILRINNGGTPYVHRSMCDPRGDALIGKSWYTYLYQSMIASSTPWLYKGKRPVSYTYTWRTYSPATQYSTVPRCKQAMLGDLRFNAFVLADWYAHNHLERYGAQPLFENTISKSIPLPHLSPCLDRNLKPIQGGPLWLLNPGLGTVPDLVPHIHIDLPKFNVIQLVNYLISLHPKLRHDTRPWRTQKTNNRMRLRVYTEDVGLLRYVDRHQDKSF